MGIRADKAIGINHMQVTRARFEVGVLYAAGALIPVVMMRMIGAEIHHWHLLMCSAFALCCVSLSTLLGAKTNRPILPSYGIGVIVLWSLLQVLL